MKKLVFISMLLSVTIIATCQDNSNIKALIAGYNSGDTIKIADLLRLTGISLNNKEYAIVSFTMLLSDGKFDYEYVSNSNKITDEMKNALSKIEFNTPKTKYIAIKDIMVQKSQENKIKIENLICKVKI